jgi:hypothetical protein
MRNSLLITILYCPSILSFFLSLDLTQFNSIQIFDCNRCKSRTDLLLQSSPILTKSSKSFALVWRHYAIGVFSSKLLSKITGMSIGRYSYKKKVKKRKRKRKKIKRKKKKRKEKKRRRKKEESTNIYLK